VFTSATKAAGGQEKIAHLEAACALYQGSLDESLRGYCLLEHREDRLRRYRDAAGDRARLVGRTDADRGLAILNTLLEHDLFNEDLCRRIMRGQVKLGRPDAVRRTFNLLETRFESVDMEVDASTRGAGAGPCSKDRRVATAGRNDAGPPSLCCLWLHPDKGLPAV
jgi:DNA-binding SARP family transcriptional activator